MISDPLSDFFIRIKNAYRAGKEELSLPFSRQLLAAANLLKKHGFIKELQIVKKDKLKKDLKLTLVYLNGQPAIKEIKRLSRPGRRLYVRSGKIPWTDNPNTVIIISTSAGLMIHRQAVGRHLGGELLAEIS